MTEYSPAKTGENPSEISQFLNLHVLQKIFEGHEDNSLYVG